MKRFKVELERTQRITIEVEAKTRQDAILIAGGQAVETEIVWVNTPAHPRVVDATPV